MSSTNALASWRYPLFVTIAIAFILGQPVCTFAQTAIVAGACNIVNQNVKLGENATLIVENDCGAQTPESSYRVRYVWLDSKNTSLVFANVHHDGIEKLLGSNPRLVKTATYNRLAEMLARFGERVGSTPFIGSSFTNKAVTKTSEAEIASKTFSDLFNIAALRRFKLYAGDQSMIWPEADATRIIENTVKWPDTYNIAYAANPDNGDNSLQIGLSDKKDTHNNVFLCTLLYKPVTREEFERYWDTIAAVEAQITESARGSMMYVNSAIGPDEFKEAATKHPTYEALHYFTAKNWPNDFLFSFGNFSGNRCDTGQFGFYAPPRQLYVQFAVIESTARLLDVSHLSFEVDPREELRLDTKTSDKLDLNLGSITLKRGETILVPLRMELRYNLDEYPFSALSNPASSREMFKAISKVPTASFTFYDDFGSTDKNRKLIRKLKSEFKESTPPRINRTYYFGSALTLKSVTVGSKSYEVRPAPPTAIVMSAIAEEASCPFLSFRLDDGDLMLHGRVLVGADANDRAMHDEVEIPPGSSSFVIAEREPETTYIKKISARNTKTGFVETIATDIVLRAGRELEIPIPPGFTQSSVMTISGHYEVLKRSAKAAR